MQQPKQVKLIKSHNGKEQFAIVLDEELGRGNFGVVRRAINMADKQQKLVAKIIPLEESRLASVETELRVIRQLPQHQNLVRVLPVKCYSTHNYYILMEYCESSLGEQLRSGAAFSEDDILRVFYQLVSGYKVLFDRKILHQDLKPDNILLKNGTYKIADFGLSVFYEVHRYDERREGTVSYIAPEKLTMKEYRGHPKSDVFSMGVVMFELLTGRHPYADYRGDIKQYVQELKNSQLRLPPSYTSQYSLRMLPLIEVVVKMVAKTEQARIGFEEIWQFTRRHELFEELRYGVLLVRRKSSEGMMNAELVVSQRSRVVTLPLHTTEQTESQLKQSLLEEQKKQTTLEQQQAVKEISDFLMSKRMIIYYFDKLARRLTVEQMRAACRTLLTDRLIFTLVMVNRCLLNKLVQEIQSPAIFSTAHWRLFRAHPNKSLMDIIMKDYRYVEDTTCDILAEDSKLPKKHQQAIMQLLKGDDLPKLLEELTAALNDYLREKVSMIEVRNKSFLKTLAYMITAADIVSRLSSNTPQSPTLEDCHRSIETSNEQALLDLITQHCCQVGAVFSLDFSGIPAATESQILSS